jgi:GntR family L-lactate dehydrogenase operon transcriptional regulator
MTVRIGGLFMPGHRAKGDEGVLLEVLASATHPVGTRQATLALREHGLTLSESTVSRLLRKLDAQHLTMSVDGKGRVLTDEGRHLLKTSVDFHAEAAHLEPPPDVRNIGELLDLLYARRAVEREVAREAALRAGPADIATLERLLERHRARLDQGQSGRGPALEFHRQVSRVSHNPFLTQIAAIVLNPRLDALEAVLDVIVGGHHSHHLSIDEHAAILEAIRTGQPDAAEAAMERHVSRLIHEIEEDMASDRAGIYERLLAWMKEQPRRD